jgi:hypothetical protein
MMKRAVVFLLMLACAACGSDSVGPGPSPPPAADRWLQPGRYVVGLTGFGVSEDPLFPTCAPLATPPTGTAVITRVSVERERDGWVIRADPPAPEGLEIQLLPAASSPGMQLVTGTARGCARDQTYGPHAQIDLRVCLGGTGGASGAPLDGRMFATSRVVIARIGGLAEFSDSSGATGRCAAVEMFLRPRVME